MNSTSNFPWYRKYKVNYPLFGDVVNASSDLVYPHFSFALVWNKKIKKKTIRRWLKWFYMAPSLILPQSVNISCTCNDHIGHVQVDQRRITFHYRTFGDLLNVYVTNQRLCTFQGSLYPERGSNILSFPSSLLVFCFGGIIPCKAQEAFKNV